MDGVWAVPNVTFPAFGVPVMRTIPILLFHTTYWVSSEVLTGVVGIESNWNPEVATTGVVLAPVIRSDFWRTTTFSGPVWLALPHLQLYWFTAKVTLSPLNPSFS